MSADAHFKRLHDTFRQTLTDRVAITPGQTGIVHLSGAVAPALPLDQMEDEHRVLVDAHNRIASAARTCEMVFEWQYHVIPGREFAAIGKGNMSAFIFAALAIRFHVIRKFTDYAKHLYATHSSEDAARHIGGNGARHDLLLHVIAAVLASIEARVSASKT
ncbi:hypothetical protein [Pseudorhodobacter sp.]|uniref:hypothetical protein n=1 Tax=Pseudorhodobacter sp. TaxID=1934400 RepID=UPI002649A56D|nr:hypothetical protein [Pseudorhodobacter sp.]MDN5787097.1 hypothetical protein [Pseudorhodobacter sp.]